VADVVPGRFVAEALVEALADVPVRCALVARAREAREVLPEALRARGAEVDVLALYETVAEPLEERVLAAARMADYITFTSSSTVRFLLEAAGVSAGGDDRRGGDDDRRGGGDDPDLSALLSPATRVVSIGPVTSGPLREHGIEPHVEAERHDAEGVLDALVADALAQAG
jgi:uroporphyrinogen III methyltransferase / synthase